MVFTTSWDDGSVHDLRIGELLSRFGMTGTFYVPKEFPHRAGKYASYERRLSDDEIRSLAAVHEVGAHGLTHSILADLSTAEAEREIGGSKGWLESVLGREVAMFCYPNGRFNEELAQAVARGGYVGARATEKLAFETPRNPFAIGVSTIAQPFPFRKINARQYYWRRLLDPVTAYRPPQFALSWHSLAQKLFRRARERGNYFHLYGHSWELEQYGLWDELASFLEFVHTHDNIRYVGNSVIAAVASTSSE